MKNYLSVCAIFKNEAPYLAEWIQFHNMQGVEKIYLYNNNSTDEYRDVLDTYMCNGLVELFDWPQQPGQLGAYRDCLMRTKDKSRWLACIDLDEFMFACDGILSDFLMRFEAYPALAVNWLIFGSNGHSREPESNVVDAYVRRAPEAFVVNRHVKCVVDPQRTQDVINPHSFVYTQGDAINENEKVVTGPLSEYTGNHVRLHHYFCKSEDYFAKKIARGRATTNSHRDWHIFHGHDRNEIFDDTASRVFHSLKEPANKL